MALFPGRPDDAVRAAIRMLERVGQLNSESKRPTQIRLGIGINTGRTMLGIIGEEERYQGTVISDAVNLASRLESLTKRVHQAVILSEATVIRLREKFGVRLLGSARVGGNEERTSLHPELSVCHPHR